MKLLLLALGLVSAALAVQFPQNEFAFEWEHPVELEKNVNYEATAVGLAPSLLTTTALPTTAAATRLLLRPVVKDGGRGDVKRIHIFCGAAGNHVINERVG